MNMQSHLGRTVAFYILSTTSFLLATYLLVSTPASANKADRKLPLDVESDRVEMRDKENISIYEGKVIVTQGTTKLEANKLTIYHLPNRRPKLVIAEGGRAHYQEQLDGNQGHFDAWGNRLEYNLETDVIVADGNAELLQGENHLSGERLIFDRKQQQLFANSNAQTKDSRVKIRFIPKQEKNK